MGATEKRSRQGSVHQAAWSGCCQKRALEGASQHADWQDIREMKTPRECYELREQAVNFYGLQ